MNYKGPWYVVYRQKQDGTKLFYSKYTSIHRTTAAVDAGRREMPQYEWHIEVEPQPQEHQESVA